MMNEWLKLFYQNNVGSTLTINGKTYIRSDCKRIGGGSEKHVYQLQGEKLCFFIPNKYRSEEDWNNKIKLEKLILDEIIQLGLKAQQFELVSISISAPGEQIRSIQALLTKDFENLCKDESIVIHDSKGNKRVTGTPPDFIAMRARFKDKEFVQNMFKKIIKEYAVAYAFSLPINILKSNDDSQHIIFELPQKPNDPPVVRYMFWDVVSDVDSFPFIFMAPTLSSLKKGPDEFTWRTEHNAALKYLSNTVACSILEMNADQDADSFEFVRELQADILLAIDDDAFLNNALAHAKSQGVTFLNKLLVELKDEAEVLDNTAFSSILLMAISSDNLDIIERCYQLRPQDSELPEEYINKILDTSRSYGNQRVIEFLDGKLGAEKNKFDKIKQLAEEAIEREKQLELKKVKSDQLKQTFLRQYNNQLASDKSSWCGLYSFFATSYITSTMDLSEIVHHAQGLSNKGSGKRSQLVMKQLGWLDEHNQVSGELSTVFSRN